jgi:hypothetical protein
MWTRFAVLPERPGVHGRRGLGHPGSRRRCFQNPASKARQLLHELLVQGARSSPRGQSFKLVGKGPYDRDLLSDSEQVKFLAQALVVGSLQRAKRR